MKKNYILKSVILVLFSVCLKITSIYAQENIIVSYKARNEETGIGIVANATATDLARGPGIAKNIGTLTFDSNNWTTGASVDLDDYVTWTVTADAGFTVSVSSIAIHYDRDPDGPTQMVMRYSTASDFSNPVDIYTDNAIPDSGVNTTITPTGGTITSPVAGTIYFRIYAYNSSDLNNGRFVIRNIASGTSFLGVSQVGVYLNGSVDTRWEGSMSTDWNDADNWPTGEVPSATTSVIIPDVLNNAPIIDGVDGASASVNNLLIEEPDGLTLFEKSTLKVNGKMDVTKASTGNVKYRREMPDGSKWSLISSPVKDQIYNNGFVASNKLAVNGTNNALGIYLPASNTWDYMQSGESGTFASGQAYAMKLEDGEPASSILFVGKPNDDDVVVSVAAGYNLLGNPYTANIEGTVFLGDASNTSIDQTQLWTWNADNGVYDVATALPENSIELIPGTGFFVRATSTGSVTFDKDNQYSVSSFGLKELESTTEVKLLMADGKTERYAKIYFAEDLSKGFDYGWEGEIFGGLKSSLAVYSYLINENEGTKYQIQSLPNSDYESLVVPIGITAVTDKEITFTTEALNLPTGIKVFLEDRETNTFTRLDEPNSEYKVTFTENVDGAGRFYLHTKSSVLSTPEVSLDDVSVFSPNATTISITGLSQGKANVRLFNILGKQVFKDSFTSNGVKNISLPNLTSGVYIVQLATEAGQLNKKITLE